MKKPRYNAPLSNIKILDFSTLLPGPMATLFLAEATIALILSSELTKLQLYQVCEDLGYSLEFQNLHIGNLLNFYFF